MIRGMEETVWSSDGRYWILKSRGRKLYLITMRGLLCRGSPNQEQ